MALPLPSQDQLDMGRHIVRQIPGNERHFTKQHLACAITQLINSINVNPTVLHCKEDPTLPCQGSVARERVLPQVFSHKSVDLELFCPNWGFPQKNSYPTHIAVCDPFS